MPLHQDMSGVDIFSVRVFSDWTISVQFTFWIVGALIAALILVCVWRWTRYSATWKDFEIDQAEIGTGTGKLSLRPNTTDRQVAYAMWVELSTRKIGLPIDFDHDLISEIYDSWYQFFSVTRELLKSVPVTKVRTKSTQKIITLSVELLNDGLRPHLTTWQARFRRWYELELRNDSSDVTADPQEIQRRFPKYEELKTDMVEVNRRLINYREHMRRLVMDH